MISGRWMGDFKQVALHYMANIPLESDMTMMHNVLLSHFTTQCSKRMKCELIDPVSTRTSALLYNIKYSIFKYKRRKKQFYIIILLN